MSFTSGITLTVVLLLLNALFVGAEFALLSARRTQLEPLAAAGSRPAKIALKAMANLSLVMAAAQLGITACSVMLGAVSEPAIAYSIEPLLHRLGIADQWLHPIAFVIALSLVVYAHVVIGEMVPKNLALAGPDRAALILGPFMWVMVGLLKPFVVFLNAIANAVLRLLKIEPKDEVSSAYSHDEVAGLIEESRREGLLDEDEYGLVTGALDFYTGTVADVLLPSADLVTVGPDTTPAQIENICADTGFSRFPVVDESGEYIGYVHIKDVLEPEGPQRTRPVSEKWMHQLVTVRLESGLWDALRAMQRKGAHIARVITGENEDIRAVGVVMLEDVLEELVGEVYDIGR